MLALAAAQLGFRCQVYAPDERGPAALVAARFTRGAFVDEAALARFAGEDDLPDTSYGPPPGKKK